MKYILAIALGILLAKGCLFVNSNIAPITEAICKAVS